QGGAAGPGDLAGFGSAGGFLEVRGETRPELQSVGVGKARELADLRSDDAGPDLVDARHALEDARQADKALVAVGEDDLAPQRLALPLDQADDVEEVDEGVALRVLEQLAVGLEPILRAGYVVFGPGEVGCHGHTLHGML